MARNGYYRKTEYGMRPETSVDVAFDLMSALGDLAVYALSPSESEKLRLEQERLRKQEERESYASLVHYLEDIAQEGKKKKSWLESGFVKSMGVLDAFDAQLKSGDAKTKRVYTRFPTKLEQLFARTTDQDVKRVLHNPKRTDPLMGTKPLSILWPSNSTSDMLTRNQDIQDYIFPGQRLTSDEREYTSMSGRKLIKTKGRDGSFSFQNQRTGETIRVPGFRTVRRADVWPMDIGLIAGQGFTTSEEEH